MLVLEDKAVLRQWLLQILSCCPNLNCNRSVLLCVAGKQIIREEKTKVRLDESESACISHPGLFLHFV